MVTQINYNNGKQVSYQYDSLGNLTCETNSNNVTTDYKLNNLNQITVKSSDRWKTQTTYTYDKRGNLIGEVYGKNKKVATPSAGGGVQIQITNADKIWDTRGVGFEVGGSILGFGISYVGGTARNGDYVHGISISPTSFKKMNFGKLESALNAAFKTGSALNKVSAVGNIAEFHGAVTFTGVYSDFSRDAKNILRALVKDYYVALTCSAFRFAAETLLGIDI